MSLIIIMGLLSAYVAWRNPFIRNKQTASNPPLPYDEQIYWRWVLHFNDKNLKLYAKYKNSIATCLWQLPCNFLKIPLVLLHELKDYLKHTPRRRYLKLKWLWTGLLLSALSGPMIFAFLHLQILIVLRHPFFQAYIGYSDR